MSRVQPQGFFELGDCPIHVASTRGAIEELNVLMSHGAQINVAGEHGYTALHDAVEQGHVAAATWLITHGADRSLRNDDGLTPLMLAHVLGDNAMQALLREK